MGKLQDLYSQARTSGGWDDRQRFMEALYRHSVPLLLSIVRNRHPHEAEDLVSDIFAFKILSKSLKDLEPLMESPLAYLAVIATNYCNDVRRRKSVLQIALEDEFGGSLPESLIYHPFNDDRLDWTMLRRYLSETQARVLSLRIRDELGFGEIQERLHLNNEAAVRQHLSRARRKLKSVFAAKAVVQD